MDWNRIEGDWKQAKGKVKEKWGKLTDAAGGISWKARSSSVTAMRWIRPRRISTIGLVLRSSSRWRRNLEPGLVPGFFYRADFRETFARFGF
jgi:hypothetical protein